MNHIWIKSTVLQCVFSQLRRRLLLFVIFSLLDSAQMLLGSEVQLLKLFWVHLAGRIRQEALASLGLWECDDIPDIIGAGEQHNEPVQTECDSTVRGSTVFECL